MRQRTWFENNMLIAGIVINIADVVLWIMYKHGNPLHVIYECRFIIVIAILAAASLLEPANEDLRKETENAVNKLNAVKESAKKYEETHSIPSKKDIQSIVLECQSSDVTLHNILHADSSSVKVDASGGISLPVCIRSDNKEYPEYVEVVERQVIQNPIESGDVHVVDTVRLARNKGIEVFYQGKLETIPYPYDGYAGDLRHWIRDYHDYEKRRDLYQEKEKL